ncbi:sulfur carrier protein ThiS [Nocardioides albus]|uniref:Sulfur carrier protein n=1 Tax=Nocardioides albus TaxID=1841 RepID=A0A7W5A9D3_9ACTN|nr:sulfur carrier protein ThiS [Nocardioides albus]MBB3091972.1 sulfur carrier protein [Nocardioides albus]GGU44073.1 thiamine biosynthesis protein ThiS [Nocardioides albus]
MKITVNSEPTEVSGTVADLLEARIGDRRPSGIAVAVDEEIVPRDDWARWQLQDGHVVEIVTAVQGG